MYHWQGRRLGVEWLASLALVLVGCHLTSDLSRWQISRSIMKRGPFWKCCFCFWLDMCQALWEGRRADGFRFFLLPFHTYRGLLSLLITVTALRPAGTTARYYGYLMFHCRPNEPNRVFERETARMAPRTTMESIFWASFRDYGWIGFRCCRW